MLEQLQDLAELLSNGRTVGVATVTTAHRSSPRPVGASMLVDSDARVLGSVSGGCVEGAVFASLQEVVGGARPRIELYGISDDDAFAVGLTCGGVIEVLVETFGPTDVPLVSELQSLVGDEKRVALITELAPRCNFPPRRCVVTASDVSGDAGWLGDAGVALARRALATGEGRVVEIGLGEARQCVFVDVLAPRPRLIVCGSTQIASAMASQGRLLGFRVTVCDARATFATRERFPDADEVVVDWPHRYLKAEAAAGTIDGSTVICVLTHDSRFEVPVLHFLLTECPADLMPGFIGVMGSRRTHDDRTKRLLDAGVPWDRVRQLSSPFGLDLGGLTPAETALSMAAEIVSRRRGGSGRPLSTLSGDIHRGRPGLEVGAGAQPTANPSSDSSLSRR